MRALQLATHGMLPLCVVGLNTSGQIGCGYVAEIERSGGGGGKRRRKVVSLDRNVVIKGQQSTVDIIDREGSRTEVIYTRPDTVRFAPPVVKGTDPSALDDEMRELQRLLQRQAIMQHQREVLEQIEEENRQAEELALFLMLLEDE